MEFFGVVGTSQGTTCRVILAQCRGVGDETAPDVTQEAPAPTEVAWPIGYVMRPSGGAPEAVCFRVADQVVAISLIDKTLSVWTDVEEGETRIYGAKEPTARLRCRADGSVDLESKSAKDVRLNGGSLKVARVTDPVRVGTLAGTAGLWPVVFTFTPQDADGELGMPVVGPTVLVSAVISNAGGAARVKA